MKIKFFLTLLQIESDNLTKTKKQRVNIESKLTTS